MTNGRRGAVPYMVKVDAIAAHAHKHGTRVFVETGTYYGEMIAAQERRFDRLLSVELDQALHQRAARRFRRQPKITVYQGDSGKRLPEMIANVEEPALFWLDAHYSGGITARGDVDSPVSTELEVVLARPYRDVILIDDAGDFDGTNGYPTLEALKSEIAERRPDLLVGCEDGIIRITPHD